MKINDPKLVRRWDGVMADIGCEHITINTRLSELEKLDSLRELTRELLSDVLSEEQEALDNLPESLQDSERGQQMQEYIDTMEEVTGELDLMDIESLADQLRDICG